MTAEQAGGRKLTELVSDHILGAENIDECTSGMHLEGVPDELWDDGAGSCPGLDGDALSAFDLLLHLHVELFVYVWAFFR
jgi:hypothetical protein